MTKNNTQTKVHIYYNILINKYLSFHYCIFCVSFWLFFSVSSSEMNAQSSAHLSDSTFQVNHSTGEITPADIRENQILRENVVREHNALIFVVIICVLLLIVLMFVGRLFYQQKTENQKLRTEMEEYRRTLGQRAQQAERAHDELIIMHAALEEKYAAQQEQLTHFQHEYEMIHIEFERFLGSSSYYFSRPLSSLKGLIQVARLVRELDNTEQLEDLFQKMDITLYLLDNMIAKLLMLERIKSRKLVSERLDFEKIIQQLKDKHTLKIQENQLDFQYKIHVQDSIIFPSEIIRIVLDNLLENAVTFTVGQPHPYVFTEITYAHGEIILKVSDNGVGVPNSYTNRIFNMYYRASELSKGCGLGLYVVKMAVKKYKGSIEVESKQGRFTEFTVRLPIYKK